MVNSTAIPQWLKCYLKDTDLKEIEAAVHEAEKRTSAEIVPMIVRTSSNYHQVPITLMLLGSAFFLLLYEVLRLEAHWDGFYTSVIFVAVSFFSVFFILPRVAQIPWVKMVFTVRAEETEQAFKRAQIEFYENQLTHTQDKVGVLIFISLLEHSVIVLGDKAIAEKLPKETWQQVVDQILGDIKQKNMSEGIKKAVATMSDLLAGPFPIKSNDVNELSNKLVIKD